MGHLIDKFKVMKKYIIKRTMKEIKKYRRTNLDLYINEKSTNCLNLDECV